MTAPRSLSFGVLTRMAETASLRADAQARDAGVLGGEAAKPTRTATIRSITSATKKKAAAPEPGVPAGAKPRKQARPRVRRA